MKTNFVTVLLSVTFFVGYVRCPPSNEQEVRLFAKLSKVIVRSYTSKVVHVYNNAALYAIKRSIRATPTTSDVNWFTIRGRKSRNENFRRLVDTCGMRVEFLLLTEKIVRLIYNENYEYTLHFDEAARAANFVNAVYPASKKTGAEVKYGLKEVEILRDGKGCAVIETSAELVQRRISDQVVVYYVRSNVQTIRLMFPSQHFVMTTIAPKNVFITTMVMKGKHVDYSYKLTFVTGQALRDFDPFATNDQFIPRYVLPESEPRDTGNSDESLTSGGHNFYDEDELKFFRETEASLDW